MKLVIVFSFLKAPSALHITVLLSFLLVVIYSSVWCVLVYARFRKFTYCQASS